MQGQVTAPMCAAAAKKIGFDIPVHDWFPPGGACGPMLLDTLFRRTACGPPDCSTRNGRAATLLNDHLERQSEIWGITYWGFDGVVVMDEAVEHRSGEQRTRRRAKPSPRLLDQGWIRC